MVTVRIDHRVTGAGADAWVETLTAPRPAMEAVRDVVAADVAERFASESDPWGGAWPALSIATVELQHKRGQPIGARTKLANSRFARVVNGGRKAVIGLRSRVARWFHIGDPANRMFGNPAPRPPRPVLPLRDGEHDLPTELREEIMEAFREGIRHALRRT